MPDEYVTLDTLDAWSVEVGDMIETVSDEGETVHFIVRNITEYDDNGNAMLAFTGISEDTGEPVQANHDTDDEVDLIAYK